jgi:hypothetical protein
MMREDQGVAAAVSRATREIPVIFLDLVARA